MFWEIAEVSRCGTAPDTQEEQGRFVLHRHDDGEGVHLDLRLEWGDTLSGWRIAGENLETGLWATEKMPHPADWLTQDRGLERKSAGLWRWEERSEDRRRVALQIGEETVRITLERRRGISAETVRALSDLAKESKMPFSALAGLAADGLQARAREIERFCALSRMLDGEGFDEAGWRSLFSGMSLREISDRLAHVEIRHDRLHPPLPVSLPEKLTEDEGTSRMRHAYQILHS
ncbi:MAG TPA: hypothetical protein PLY90_09900 [Candidatus Hydrogenedentes bacterium]|jgi:hypothetical protein|nr:MAG: hypothetical protein BWY07_02171 [Candidatus Hydrogenedentes bacterium ADurb.Bin170]HNZ49370.1 hypothetical protein [Candidatus Hydrogenedentota bacterium]HOD96545.1 hypothetical protein [Candidatus Hydrogenedentota bacterium]HOM49207.1 hypothetical protein [Candidatus Hydrogenedentota bacterium]HOR51937.1 hypothetical protein [Candidatus Hydrogenedentota bacterium]